MDKCYISVQPLELKELILRFGFGIKFNKNGDLIDIYVDCEKTYDDWRLKDHEEGSLRVSEIELERMNLKATPVEVKKNTLVLGNVGGFHGRGNTKKPFTRNAIHGSIRLTEPYLF